MAVAEGGPAGATVATEGEEKGAKKPRRLSFEEERMRRMRRRMTSRGGVLRFGRRGYLPLLYKSLIRPSALRRCTNITLFVAFFPTGCFLQTVIIDD
jgi:hypothetical protein